MLTFLVKIPHFFVFDYRNGTRWDESQAIKTQVQPDRIKTFIAECWSESELLELNKLLLIDLVCKCLDFNPVTRITTHQAVALLQSTCSFNKVNSN